MKGFILFISLFISFSCFCQKDIDNHTDTILVKLLISVDGSQAKQMTGIKTIAVKDGEIEIKFYFLNRELIDERIYTIWQHKEIRK